MGRTPRLPSLGIALCLFFLLAPASANKCIVGCDPTNPTKSYAEGHTYTYDLEGISVTSVSDAQGESRLKINAIVEMAVQTNCAHQLRLKNVLVNGAAVALDDLKKHALQFNYHGGRVDTALCAEVGDSQTSLNIKRAVVSLFQSAIMQNSGATTDRETDVFGSCKTEFNFHKEGDSLIVQKYRNLADCSHRESIRHGLITSAFDPSAEMQSSPLLGSRQKVEQRFKRGILDKAVSVETYVLKPFGNGEAGAKINVETTLTFKSEKAERPNAPVSEPKSLIFEPPHPMVDSSVGAIVKALKAVKEECPESVVKERAAVKFADLVRVVGLSGKNDILTVYRQVESGAGFDKKTDKKILLDALFRSGSGEAAEVAVELIKSGRAKGLEALAYYASLALVRHVDLPTVVAVTSLLDEPGLPRIGYLGVGRVIGKYCAQHECDNVPEVRAALANIIDKTGNRKYDTREKENIAVAALKALANAGYHDDKTMERIVALANDKKVRNRVRVAAIEALPSTCSMKWKKPIFEVFADREEDSEIRIESYLSMVRCVCPHVANKVKEVLDEETMNQVGSFVTTHLRNLRASTDPTKREAKRQLEHIKPRNKFPEDTRKFSFNNELSYNVGAFGLGSTADSNVIYSQRSFVPRSVSLNLTSEIFGHAFNFLEIDARIENLDRLIERYFGPKGELGSQEIVKLAMDGKTSLSAMYEKIKDRLRKTTRGRRDVGQDNLDKFAKKVHFLGGEELDDELDVDLSLKMFGVELAYLDYRGTANGLHGASPDKLIDAVFDILEKGIDEARDFDHRVESHSRFLRVDIVYPTGLGVPMSLGLTGTSVVKLRASGKIDLPGMIKDPGNAFVRIALEPSAAISVVGSLAVDGLGVESGLRLVGTLHTSTGSDLSIKILDGAGIDVTFGIPKRKQEILSVSSDVQLVDTSGKKSEKYVTPKFAKGKEHADCFEQLSVILGVTICGRVSYPYDSIESVQKRPIFPLSGPAKFALSVDNDDVTNYHFRAFYETKNEKARSLEVTFETPNSKNDRRLSLRLDGALEPNKFVKASLDSPYKKLSAEVLLKNTPEEQSLVVTAINDVDEYFLRAGVVVNNGNRYKPILEYKVPEHIEKLASSKTATKSSHRDGQLYRVQGDVEVTEKDNAKTYNFEKVVVVASGRPLASLDGFVVSRTDGLVVDAKLAHGDENIVVKMDAERTPDSKLSVDLAVVPSKDPNVGFKILGTYHVTSQLVDHNFVFVYGPDLNSNVNRLTVRNSFERSGIPASVGPIDEYPTACSVKSKLTWPAQELDSDFELELSPAKLDTEYELTYGKFKIRGELETKVEGERIRDFAVGFAARILENGIALEAKGTRLAEHKNKFEGLIELPGGKYEAEADVTYDVAGNTVDVRLDGELKINGKKIKVAGGVAANPQKASSHAVVTLDSTKYLDFLLKLQRGAHPHGTLSLNLKNLIIVGGQFKYQNDKGNANLNVDLPSLHRKIKGTGEVSISGSRHNANVELLYDADNDPSRSIKLSTISDVTKESIDSKNVIEILTYKTEIDVSATLKNTDVGRSKFEGVAAITLPNARYILLKALHYLIRDGKKNRLDGAYEIADSVAKGGKTAKLTYTTELAWDEGTEHEHIGKHSLVAQSFEGKNMKLDVSANHERLPNTDKKKSELTIDLAGSYLPKPFHFALSGNCNANDGDWKIESTLGNDLGLKGQGEFARGNSVDKPAVSETSFEFKFPSEKLRSLKCSSKQTVLIPHEDDGLFEYISSGSLTYNDDNNLKADLHLTHTGIPDREHKSEGTGKLTLTILRNPSLTIGATYKSDPTGETKKSSGTLNVNYGDKEASIASDLSYSENLNAVSLNARATTPVDKFRNVELKVSRKKVQEDRNEYDLVLVADEIEYTINSEFQINPMAKSIRIVMTCPAGKTELFGKFNDIGDNSYTGEWKVESPKGFVAADARVKIDNIDSFFIEFNFDSDKMKHRKIHAEIATKAAAKTGKRIIVTVTSDGKNIVTGSTNYSQRDEAGKIIVEGNGSLKIGENTRSSKFTYSRKQLTREVDGEVGVAILLNANFGPSAVVGDLKLSNKEIHIFNSYCEQSKDCAHFKLQSAFDRDNESYVNHQLTVEVDLKKFNVPLEFGLQTTTKYLLKEPPTFDHKANLYVHTSKDKSQYSSHIHIHPKDSAIVISLPSRELALVSSFEIPKSRHAETLKIEVSVYLDRKNRPNDKTCFAVIGEIKIDKNTATVGGEAKFTYPSQPKEMMVKGRLHYGGEHLLDANIDIDVFAKKTQKIVLIGKLIREHIPKGYNVTGDFEINSRGQQLKVALKQHLAVSGEEIGFGSFLSYTDQHQKPKSLGALFYVNAKEARVLVRAPSKDLVKADTSLTLTDNLQKIDTEYTILDNPTVVVNFEANNLNSFKYQHNDKNNPKNRVTVNGRIVIGQLAEIHADLFKNNEKKNLFNVLVHLDENKFFKPDFGYNRDNIVAVIDSYRARGIELAKELKEVGQDVGEEAVVELKDLVQHLKKAQPNLKPLVDYYNGELTKLKNELHADETIKEIQTTLHKVFGGVVAAVTETLKQLAGQISELGKQLHEIVEKLAEAAKAIYPHLKESFDKIFKAGIEIFDAAAKLATIYLKAILNIINEHQKEIKQLLSVAADLTQDIAKIITKGISAIEKDLKDFVVLTIQQIKALPIYEFIKEKYGELANYRIPDGIWIPFEEACVQLTALLPTEELKEFFTVIYSYVLRHVKHEKVDESTEIKKIYGLAIEAIHSLIQLLQSETTVEKLFGLSVVGIPVDISAIKHLPGISSLRLSIFNLVRNRELPSPADIYYAYRPTLHPGDVIPPFSKTGIFLEGGHFFTFDGRHLTMAGTCDYIIAQDMRDGNFSVVANLSNGKLTSVTLTAPSETITIKSNGNILANGKPAEYPVSTENIHAFLTPPIVNVKSDFGVHLMCTPISPMICGVHVSGFYLGKLRGILGDGNNEPYDDFTLPSGHITENEAEFGNSYRLNSGCAAAPAVNHKTHKRHPTCTEYFSGSSSLSSCFNYVDPSLYRQACDHATGAATPQAACLVASAYWVACLKERVFVSIPNACGNCNVRGENIAIGDSFSVKLPQKEADIVFVIEQDIQNEKVFKELIQPLVAEVKNELKHQGVTDVHIGLIGFGEHMTWPQHYTTGGNININGEVSNMDFAKTAPLISFQEAKEGDLSKRAKFLKQRLDVELGTFRLTDAYEEAIHYPFRIGAAKIVVGVIASPCEKSPLPLSLQQLRLLMGLKVYRDIGLTYHHVSFLNDIVVSGKPQKNIVGYDAESAYTFADSKKKPLEGSSDMKNNLVLTSNDVCAGFAISSGGAAFSANHFLEAKPNQKKQFIQVTSRRLADGIVNNQLNEDCVCELRMGINAHANCKIVGRQQKEPLARHTKGGGVKG